MELDLSELDRALSDKRALKQQVEDMEIEIQALKNQNSSLQNYHN